MAAWEGSPYSKLDTTTWQEHQVLRHAVLARDDHELRHISSGLGTDGASANSRVIFPAQSRSAGSHDADDGAAAAADGGGSIVVRTASRLGADEPPPRNDVVPERSRRGRCRWHAAAATPNDTLTLENVVVGVLGGRTSPAAQRRFLDRSGRRLEGTAGGNALADCSKALTIDNDTATNDEQSTVHGDNHGAAKRNKVLRAMKHPLAPDSFFFSFFLIKKMVPDSFFSRFL